jgi:hypothetical protein
VCRELEQNILYATAHGNSLVRTSRTQAVLNEKILLRVDLCDAAGSPRASFDEDGRASGGEAAIVGSALSHVRALSATPTADTLGALQHTLSQLAANDDGWLDSFLALDGMQALLDVLSHSQQQQAPPPPTPPLAPPPTAHPSGATSPTTADGAECAPASPYEWSAPSLQYDTQALTPLLLIGKMPPPQHRPPSGRSHHSSDGHVADEVEHVQARCVGCLSLLLSRRVALDALLAHTHAVTCVVAALDCRAVDTQCRVAGILLRIALAPRCVPPSPGPPVAPHSPALNATPDTHP